ncbi:MAG: hypothetical protein KME64_34155 [Scytonematopsis contorta HA4267-MV1]|jgi:hypothetical protein|nr:hypothetical protein [Scytonematopsis contorta HA4267-MV1]
MALLKIEDYNPDYKQVFSTLGKPVTVNGKVQNILGKNAIVLDENDIDGNEYLSVTDITLPQGINVVTQVQATGTVRQFERDKVTNKYNLDAVRPIPAFWKTVPAIVANSIKVVLAN